VHSVSYNTEVATMSDMHKDAASCVFYTSKTTYK